MQNIELLKNNAKKIRKAIIEAGYQSHSAHYGGSLSCADMMAYIFSIMKNIDQHNRDRFILSKGHCALALYGTLYVYGYITKEELHSFNSNNSPFPSHCIKNIEKGIELSSGSLGMGLSYAIGQAIALKKKSLDNKIFVLVGNGEANEGSFWEAVMFAGAKKVNNLILILDNNKMQLDGNSTDIMPITKWKEKFDAFEWNSIEIDGNDMSQIDKAFKQNLNYPLVIIANTIKGKGISFMENDPKWHHNSMTEEEYNQATLELEGAE